MDKLILKASKRDAIGKKVKNLRREGFFPAIIYGKDMKEPLPVSLNLRETTKFMRGVGSSTVITLDVEGKEYPTLIRDRQYDVIRGDFLHMDFLLISMTEKVTTMVSITVEGESPAVSEFGAIVINGITEIEVEALPTDLPETLVVDISSLENIGDGLYVRDLILPDGVEGFADPDEMIVVISAPTMVEEEEEEALEEELEDMDVEPEVIEKGKGEDEEGEEE
jgi:large subunit ribosomal protein L25